MNLKQDMLVIFASDDGHDGPAGWTPLRPEEVPHWVRSDPDLLAHMVDGDMVHDPRADPRWFRAQRVADTMTDDKLLAMRSPAVMQSHRPLVILPGQVDL